MCSCNAGYTGNEIACNDIDECKSIRATQMRCVLTLIVCIYAPAMWGTMEMA